MKPWLYTLVLLAAFGCQTTSGLEVISGFDAQRYMGRWYEVARYPHRFEKNLSAVTAEYTLNKNGTIKVVNRGYDEKKKQWKDIEGIAKFKGSRNLGFLKVSFFRPFYASYRIIHLSPDYTRAIVAGPNSNYLWILTREPNLPTPELELLIQKAEELGFDRNKLQLIDHSRLLKEKENAHA